MDIEFTPEQELFRSTVRDFCDREITREYVRECDRDRRPPTELYRKLGEQGWLGINIPEENGGAGGGAVEVAILLEELGESFLDLAFWVFRAVTWGGLAISRDGTEQQKQELLPKVASGELSVCFSLTEPDAGSDAASISLKAEQDGDDYILNGQKVFTSGFKASDLDVVATRTSSEGKKHHGITNFLVDCDTPGLEWHPIETLGHWPLGTGNAHLHRRAGARAGCSAPAQRLERPGRLSPLRAPVPVGRPDRRRQGRPGRFDSTTPRPARQFDQPISNFQAVSHRLAEMQVMTEISEMLVYRYAARLDKGKATTRDAAILKLYACESYKQVADMGLQVLGGYGYTMEYDLQRHLPRVPARRDRRRDVGHPEATSSPRRWGSDESARGMERGARSQTMNAMSCGRAWGFQISGPSPLAPRLVHRRRIA